MKPGDLAFAQRYEFAMWDSFIRVYATDTKTEDELFVISHDEPVVVLEPGAYYTRVLCRLGVGFVLNKRIRAS